MRRLIFFVRSWFVYSSVFRKITKLEHSRKEHIKHLASRMNELERMLRKIREMEKKVVEDAEKNESVIRVYEESLDVERGKLRVAEETILNQVLRNDKFREQYKADIAASVRKQGGLPTQERIE